MDAYRRGDRFIVEFDLPGVEPESIELTVEQNVLTVRAERRFELREGDEVIVAERPQGAYARQVFLGEALDAERVQANCRLGVLTLTIPVVEAVKPRRVPVAGEQETQTIEPPAPAAPTSAPPDSRLTTPGAPSRALKPPIQPHLPDGCQPHDSRVRGRGSVRARPRGPARPPAGRVRPRQADPGGPTVACEIGRCASARCGRSGVRTARGSGFPAATTLEAAPPTRGAALEPMMVPGYPGDFYGVSDGSRRST